ncbi:MAG TPA: single-stranded DNA-binding protein [Candidatus Paceibacterota bacterium]
MYLNKVFVFGNLTRDPELKSLPSGIQVCSFSVATNRTWKNKEGQKQENVEFHNIVFFGKLAELIAQYLKKGRSILVEGRIQTRSWDAQDGTKKYRTEIIGESFQFGPGGSASGAAPAAKAEEPKEESDAGSIEYPENDINPDDIPF